MFESVGSLQSIRLSGDRSPIRTVKVIRGYGPRSRLLVTVVWVFLKALLFGRNSNPIAVPVLISLVLCVPST